MTRFTVKLGHAGYGVRDELTGDYPYDAIDDAEEAEELARGLEDAFRELESEHDDEGRR
jgi:hypothetical protein